MRLLSEPGFGEEFDTIVDELTDDYLKNDLSDDERKRVETYFLSATERQAKLEFATELLRRAETERGKRVTRPSVFEQIAAFWRQQSFAHIALTAAAVIVVVGIIYFLTKSENKNYLALNLTISAAERNEGAAAERVKLPPNSGLKITLTIPEDARGAKSYVARLVGGGDLDTEQATDKTVIVTIPAGKLTRRTYAIQLFKNTNERIPGSYYFAVE